MCASKKKFYGEWIGLLVFLLIIYALKTAYTYHLKQKFFYPRVDRQVQQLSEVAFKVLPSPLYTGVPGVIIFDGSNGSFDIRKDYKPSSLGGEKRSIKHNQSSVDCDLKWFGPKKNILTIIFFPPGYQYACTISCTIPESEINDNNRKEYEDHILNMANDYIEFVGRVKVP